jgi:hypothetical protein
MNESRFTKSANRHAALLCAALIFLFLGVAVASAESPRAYRVARVSPRGADNRIGLRASEIITQRTYLPMIAKSFACAPISGEVYSTVAIISAPTDRPAEIHPDLNLALRGYVSTTGTLGLVDYGGPGDPNAPQLYTLFANNRTPAFSAAYRVYDWNWMNNRRGALIGDPSVTLAGMVVTPTEIIRVPASGNDIGWQPTGYAVMVLYAAPNRITLKYTREDNVVLGYTIHIENICVDPHLLALYNSMNASGRARLPALFAGQGIGRAITAEIGVAIRDAGSFLDPRSRKDWWQGR